MRDIRILGIVDEAPFDPLTWSGSSRHLFEAFTNHGVLADALSVDPGFVVKGLAKLMSFHPIMAEWKRRYHLSTYLFNQMSLKGSKLLKHRTQEFTVLMQVGAWYNLSACGFLTEKIRCSYHDGNLATQMKRSNSGYRFDKGYVKQAFNFEKAVYQNMDLIFPMSEWLRKSFIEDFGCSADKVIAVGAGINLKYVPKITCKDYSRANILFIGIDFERKGGYTLLEAFNKVRREIPRATLTIIGPNLKGLPDGVSCVRRIKKNTPDGEKRLHEAYLAASVFVMPSQYEPFGIVFAEAMAHKVPCIGARACAMPEIIDHGKTGFIVAANDSRALEKRIIELLKNQEMCQLFGQAGYTKYSAHYTWDRVTHNIIRNIKKFRNK